ncbi:unnamed protein product [Prorocentrum cordatum]|uniref:Uncharacterized protein n=1 Tax=Prorocentrum cordatum TaxID=2364126 RepID=A0ABN9PDV9_9DINO|nr:unnamed protein product [Polarella glacialis]
MASPPAWWSSAEESLLEKQEDKMKEMLTPIKQDVQTLKGDVTGIKQSQKELEERVGKLETAQPASSWRAIFVEIMGLCEWEYTSSKGMNRTEATEMVLELKGQLPQELREHVREMQLKGPRNYAIRIPMAPEYLQEIRVIWNEYLTKEDKKWKMADTVIYVHAERHPDVQAQYTKLGRVKDWVRDGIDATLEPKVRWSPDFSVVINKSDTEGDMGVKATIVLCEVQLGGGIVWHDEGLRIGGLSKTAAEEGVKRVRRKGPFTRQ